MRVVAPKPFLFEGGSRAVLLLHGFTGTTADVRMLGRYLEKSGYTCYAPLYKGHGVPPEELLKAGPEDWWADVVDGYRILKEKGYEEIAVAGLSLGGVYSLKMSTELPIKGVVTMCAPVKAKSDEAIYDGIIQYAKNYKKLEGKDDEQIAEEMTAFKRMKPDIMKEIKELFQSVHSRLDEVTAPLFVVQARHDEMIDSDSANTIYEQAQSEDKTIKWYEHSTHVITLGKEKEELHKDVEQFLNRLNWTT